MKNQRLFLILLSGLTALTLHAQLPDSLLQRFTYTKKPVSYKTDSAFVTKGIKTERVTWLSTDSFVTAAFIVHPKATGKKTPLLIFQHWGEGDKTEFLNEAIAFAEKGFVCLLPDGPWLCPNTPIRSFKRQGYDMYRQCVMNVRTAIDLAESNFKIDTTKIFFAGHSFGCNTGAILSATEKRIRYFIFMAGAYSTTENIIQSKFPDFVEWKTTDPEQFRTWVKNVRPLDAALYLPYKTKPCLIQVASKDEYISVEENELFIRNTPLPKEVKSYDCTHILNESARTDRMEWILQLLKNRR